MSSPTVPASVMDAVKAVREGQTGWTVIGYEGKKDLKVVASGPGGFSEMCEAFIENDFCYGYYRTSLLVDKSNTTKFVFVRWAPESTPPMRKALFGTHGGFLSDNVFQPYHVDLKASDRSDLVEQSVVSKLENAAGVGVHEISKADAADRPRRSFTGKASAADKGLEKAGFAVSGESSQVSVSNEQDLKSAFADVRSDETETNWLLVDYESKNRIKLLAKGDGGADEMKGHFGPTSAMYGLVREVEQIDQSRTVKFVYIMWQPDTIPLVEKAKLATHKGELAKLFSPFHTDMSITTLDEISSEIIRNRLSELSGRGEAAQKRLNSVATTPRGDTTNRNRTFSQAKSAVSTSGAAVAVNDREQIESSIREVRLDESSNTWILLEYEPPKVESLRLRSIGGGDVSSMAQAINPETTNYGLYRTYNVVDKSRTVKFVFINFQPESLPMIHKARVSTHIGFIRELIGQAHVELFVDSVGAITQESIETKIAEVAGTLSKVQLE